MTEAPEPAPSSPPSWLPGLWREIAELAGMDAMCALAAARGGMRVSFPYRPQGSWLTGVVGERAAAALCAAFAGCQLDLPLDPFAPQGFHGRRARVTRALAEGASTNEVARLATITRRQVLNVKRRLAAVAARRGPDLVGD